MIGRNPRNRESPDEIGKVDRYGHNMHRAGQRCFEILALIGSPQLLLQSYSPVGQDSWPNRTNLEGLHSGRGFVGNKQFFTCGT